ncbi:hypothetical protein TH61_10305 [Rufibacter sp. DG15C]|uniref:putative LPS assembly protein LptD n=1 Tax=Rufibacter sp. DG15C TaxID=1379909 RepID=UPI00078C38E8|nr:putative LPS assembly protein LptD [Rufibacter sp. DG15C]AMM51486.1 hypothetical protein TH61_10305 [Rufibacter sp. DG15C]
MIQKRSLQFLAVALLVLAAVFTSLEGKAQVRPTRPDTLSVSVRDTAKTRKGDIETTINYKAKDSIRYDAIQQIMHLYGTAHIDYGEIALDAAYIQINWKTNTLTADGILDSAGVMQEKPLFKNGAETYQAQRIVYNYKTKKGKVSGAVTTQGEGFIHAETIKKNELNEIYGRHARYTTCNLEHPHFYIKATKMKVIPSDRVVAGPFHLVFADVPTPIGFPFGFFPSPQKRGSGIIIPSFGESAQQGFYLREGGFYWAVNDYLDMRFTGDIYSLGGYGVQVQSNYISRYKFSGNFNLRHSYTKGAEDLGGANLNEDYRLTGDSRDIWISWSHTPIVRPGKGQFSASVNAGSQFFNQRNPTSAQQALSPSFNSTVSYRKSSPNSPINYSIQVSQSQSQGTNSYSYQTPDGRDTTITEATQNMSFVLPDFSLGVASQSPLEWFGVAMTGRWVEGIRIGYNLTARQNVSNTVSSGGNAGYPFSDAARKDTTLAINGTNLSEIFRNARTSINHDIPITLGTINLFKFFKLTPSVSYNESWFTKKFTYSSIPNSDLLKIDTVSGFHRAYQYSGGVSFTTNVYGIANFKGKKVQAIRHTITPNLGYSFRPDFGRPEFGFYQRVQSDANGNTQLLSRFQGLEGNVPGPGLTSAMTFGIDNNVEMKVKTESDSAGGFKKVSLIDRFAIRSAYNFAADSFKLSNINVDLSTRLFNNFPLTAGAVLDPYQYDQNNRRIDRLLVEGGGLSFARITSLYFNTSFELNPTARKQQQNSTAPPPTNLPSLQRDLTAADYVAFNIPWTLAIDLTSNFGRDFENGKLENQATSAGINGSVTLTDKWMFNYTTNYDFKNKMLSYTNIAITRDLHCWQMSINWVPFGPYQMYSININAKSSILQDLRIRRTGSSNPYRY